MLWHIKKRGKGCQCQNHFSNSLSSHVGKQLEEKPFVRKMCFSKEKKKKNFLPFAISVILKLAMRG